MQPGSGRETSVSLKNPDTRITLLRAGDRIAVTTLLWENEERFFDRRAHLRPRNHPTGLNPKLARAMVNLAGPAARVETVLDPFCGAGGILLEGALAGRQMTGMDIDERQIARAEENLTHYHAAATLTVGDATACDRLGAFDALVTDLPLGKNAKLQDPRNTFSGFFEAATMVTDVLVVAIDASFDLATCFGEFWEEEARFDWYLHKGMVKRVFLLGK